MKFVAITETPDEAHAENLLLLCEISYNGKIETEVWVGSYFNGHFVIDEPSVFEYPVNYCENTYKVIGWRAIPFEVNLSGKTVFIS